MQVVAPAILILSWTGVAIAYGLSSAGGFVPSCMPHIDGCTSISSTGRHGTGFFVFKAFMIPVAVLLLVYWRLCHRWLGHHGDAESWRNATLALGAVGAVMLMLYTSVLGLDGDLVDELRSYGVVFFFGFTFIGSLLVTYRSVKLFGSAPAIRLQTALALLVLVEGVILVATSNSDRVAAVQDAAEWRFMTALSLHPALVWLQMRRAG